MKPIVWAVLFVLACASTSRAQPASQKQSGGGATKPADPAVPPAATSTDSEDETGVRFVFTDRPSLRFGSMLRIDFRVKLQGDFRRFDPPDATDPDGFEMNRRRIGIQGTFLRHFEYELEREIREENVWRDVFVNFRYFDDFQIRGGKFKVPFSLEQLTGPTDLDFVYRTNVVNDLSPARDIGVSVHGQFGGRAFGYDVGVFQHDGENASFGDNPGAERTIAGRVTARPLRLTAIEGSARELTVGFAMTSGAITEGLNSLRGRTAFRENFFEPVNVNGQRLRFGLEADWEPGPFSIKGEFIRVKDERLGQGVLAEDLPAVEAQGWYVSGTWVVTGESKFGGITPRSPLFRGGAGALEVATRYERLGFGSSFEGEPELTSPRAANLLETSDTAWTIGANWYINRWTKLQVNLVREWIEDAGRSPIPDRQLFWTRVFRLQFVL
jgi:phosphate-selective porin OprO/OprP